MYRSSRNFTEASLGVFKRTSKSQYRHASSRAGLKTSVSARETKQKSKRIIDSVARRRSEVLENTNRTDPGVPQSIKIATRKRAPTLEELRIHEWQDEEVVEAATAPDEPVLSLEVGSFV